MRKIERGKLRARRRQSGWPKFRNVRDVSDAVKKWYATESRRIHCTPAGLVDGFCDQYSWSNTEL